MFPFHILWIQEKKNMCIYVPVLRMYETYRLPLRQFVFFSYTFYNTEITLSAK